jgi:pyruvate dehydrogenase E1 component alpha subunit
LKNLEIINFLYLIYKIRFVEEKLQLEYPSQNIRCPIHLSIGQEAVAAAVSLSINKLDSVISFHRSHAHYIAKGGSIYRLFAELLGKKDGCSEGNGGSMHLTDISKNFIASTAIVSNSIPVGLGLAFSLKLSSQKNKVIIYIGDASIEEGVFFESLNFAVLRKIPVIFICENNNYSVYTHFNKRQPSFRKIYKLAERIGSKSYLIKDHQPSKIFYKTKKIIRSSKNNSPIFIEYKTNRLIEHCGVNNDDHLNYRNIEDLKNLKRKDPLVILEKEILRKKILPENFINKKKNEIKNRVNLLYELANEAKPPNYKNFLKKYK